MTSLGMAGACTGTGGNPGHKRAKLACIDEIDMFALPFDVLDGKQL